MSIARHPVIMFGKSGFNFATNMMAYWKLATNALDSSGLSNNGAATGITYSGGYAQFGAGKFIDVTDTDYFTFTDGTNDLKAGFLIAFKQTSKTGTQYIINKRTASTQREWLIAWSGGDIYFQFLTPTNSANGYIQLVISGSLITTGVLNTIYFEYDGSKAHTGLKAYLNGNTSVGTSSVIGTYTGQVNGSSQVRMGDVTIGTTSPWLADGKEFAVWKGRTMTGSEIQELHDRVVAGTPLI